MRPVAVPIHRQSEEGACFAIINSHPRGLWAGDVERGVEDEVANEWVIERMNEWSGNAFQFLRMHFPMHLGFCTLVALFSWPAITFLCYVLQKVLACQQI